VKSGWSPSTHIHPLLTSGVLWPALTSCTLSGDLPGTSHPGNSYHRQRWYRSPHRCRPSWSRRRRRRCWCGRGAHEPRSPRHKQPSPSVCACAKRTAAQIGYSEAGSPICVLGRQDQAALIGHHTPYWNRPPSPRCLRCSKTDRLCLTAMKRRPKAANLPWPSLTPSVDWIPFPKHLALRSLTRPRTLTENKPTVPVSGFVSSNEA